ncbi:MAG TPA: hypothetical protein HPP50_04035 [Rhodospirillaceae bacterium]|jgi:hypothetical protein|nr:hypothetical protein [Rhodospirillales bacterium]HIJ44199.1 hypothetical protein [Rhodospirillaceae bacterium]HIJ45316.1 hypothetical protein [Rhodospirillaceae bacterium]HIJ94065.1 hypothetical protein [Rhodospirillaceae bacterium]HJP54321.1 hypothetical protein [Rhodospirillales bacterium]
MPGSKTRDETTDWEAVFENKENGFVSLIENAPSKAALRKCTNIVIHALLRRKDDAANKLACKKSLEKIIPAEADADTKTGADMETTRIKIVELLRTIKEIRKKKALDCDLAGQKPQPPKTMKTTIMPKRPRWRKDLSTTPPTHSPISAGWWVGRNCQTRRPGGNYAIFLALYCFLLGSVSYF